MKRFYTLFVALLVLGGLLNIASAQNVEFRDANLAGKVRSALNLPAGAAIPIAQLETLTVLDASASEETAAAEKISDLTGLEHAVQLTELNLSFNQITDINPIAGLTQLTRLGLWFNQISDISPIAGLTNLTALGLESNAISDINPLRELTQLTWLDISSNEVQDISSLAGLTQLIWLFLGGNEISDVAPLVDLVNLEFLQLSRNPITDASPLQSLLEKNPNVQTDVDVPQPIDDLTAMWMPDPNLRRIVRQALNLPVGAAIPKAQLATLTVLDAGHRRRTAATEKISDLTGLEHAVQLTELNLSYNQIIDIGPLAGLTQLTRLGLWFNQISDITPTAGLTNLTALGLESNVISDISPLVELTQLTWLDISSNEVQDISSLAGLTQLTKLFLTENAISDLSPLAGLTQLIWLFLGGNEISDVAPLVDLVNLEFLQLSRNPITDASPLQSLLEKNPNVQTDVDAPQPTDDPAAESTHKLAKVSGDVQEGTFGSELAEPLVVEVRDQNDNPLQGVQVTFTVTAGEGKLSGKFTVEDKTTDANGRAEIALTLGQMVTNTVGVSIAGRELVEFYAIGNSPSHVASLEGMSSTFSRDGSLLASGSFDGTVKLWDVATQDYIAALEGHTDGVWSVAFSPDGSLLATASSDSTVKLWNVQTKESIATLEGHRWEVSSVSFSPDGLLLVSESFGTIKLWDVGTQENIVTLEGGVALFSPGGSLLAFLSIDGIKLWDVGIQENIATLEGHTDVAWSVGLSFSLDGSLLASGSSDGTIKLWNVATQENIATLEGHTSQIFSMSFSPDGMLLASLSQSGAVNLWDVETKEHTTLSQGKYTEAFGSHLVSFSPDGSLLAFALGDAVALWDVKKGSLISLLEGYVFPGDTPIHFVSFSPDGTLLASVAFIFNTIKLWDVGAHITPPEPEKIAEDVNGDGTVNILDLVLIASNLGETGQNAADVNKDKIVDIRDLVKVAGALGNVAAAPSLHPQAFAMLTAADIQQWLAQAQSIGLTDATSLRGIRFLEQLLAALIPKTTALLPNYPNPFNPETWMPYRLANSGNVQITIYDARGTAVRRLELGHQRAGYYTSRSRAAYWDGTNHRREPVASGVYFYQLQANDISRLRKMVIMK